MTLRLLLSIFLCTQVAFSFDEKKLYDAVNGFYKGTYRIGFNNRKEEENPLVSDIAQFTKTGKKIKVDTIIDYLLKDEGFNFNPKILDKNLGEDDVFWGKDLDKNSFQYVMNRVILLSDFIMKLFSGKVTGYVLSEETPSASLATKNKMAEILFKAGVCFRFQRISVEELLNNRNEGEQNTPRLLSHFKNVHSSIVSGFNGSVPTYLSQYFSPNGQHKAYVQLGSEFLYFFPTLKHDYYNPFKKIFMDFLRFNKLSALNFEDKKEKINKLSHLGDLAAEFYDFSIADIDKALGIFNLMKDSKNEGGYNIYDEKESLAFSKAFKEKAILDKFLDLQKDEEDSLSRISKHVIDIVPLRNELTTASLTKIKKFADDNDLLFMDALFIQLGSPQEGFKLKDDKEKKEFVTNVNKFISHLRGEFEEEKEKYVKNDVIKLFMPRYKDIRKVNELLNNMKQKEKKNFVHLLFQLSLIKEIPYEELKTLSSLELPNLNDYELRGLFEGEEKAFTAQERQRILVLESTFKKKMQKNPYGAALDYRALDNIRKYRMESVKTVLDFLEEKAQIDENKVNVRKFLSELLPSKDFEIDSTHEDYKNLSDRNYLEEVWKEKAFEVKKD